MFKESKYRIATYYLSLFGLKGSWEDLHAIGYWYNSHNLVPYPDVLNNVWSTTSTYVEPLSHPEWSTISEIVNGWPKFMEAHREYIRKSINEAKAINEIK